MNKSKIALALIVVICWFIAGNTIAQQKSFTKTQVIEDLTYLKQSLEQAHYDLYAYVPKENFDANFEAILQSLHDQDTFDLKSAISLCQRVISRANTGHAEIDFPITSYIAYATNGGTLFPLEVALEQDKVLVRKNLSDNTAIKNGMELVAIDGRNIKTLIQKIYPQLSAERIYFKNAKLEFWSFPRLYWQVFGEQKSFDIALKDGDQSYQHTLKSITVGEYESGRKGEILHTERDFHFIDEVAYLNPGPFGSNAENGEALFQNFVDSAFTQINQKNTKVLIVDLRNNSGGHNAYSDYLVTYFADKPFKWHSKFTLKSSDLLKQQTRKHNDTTDAYFKTILAQPNGTTYEFTYDAHNPVDKAKRYKGEVYVLINRQTYSMAAVTAAMIQDYNFATIVGETTGDLPTLYASQFSYPLPQTGITVKIPKGYIVRPNGSEALNGVMPDIEIRDHLLDDQDEILDGLLERLGKNKAN